MSSTYDPSASQSRSDNNFHSNTTTISQRNEGVTDRASRRAPTGADSESYLGPYRRVYGSSVELGQLSGERGPHPASSRPLAYQEPVLKGPRPIPDFERDRVVPVCASLKFDPWARDSDIQPQPPGNADRPHNPFAPTLSSSKSTGLAPPIGSYPSRRNGALPGPMKSSLSMASNEQSRSATHPPV